MFPSEEIKVIELHECLDYLYKLDWIAVDTETMGLDPHTKDIISIQLGDFENQFVFDTNDYSLYILKKLLETKNLIFQNAKFDLQFLYKYNIYPNSIYDTFLAECILQTGYEDKQLSLAYLGDKYCNVMLDKTPRGAIQREGLSDRIILYGADDVKYLHKIKEEQLKKIQEYNLENVLALENDVVRVFAHMEYVGVPINKERWSEVAIITSKNVKELEDKLDNIIKEESKTKPKLKPFVVEYKQSELSFEGIEASIQRNTYINWGSNQQKLKVLKLLGLKLDSVGEDVLQKFKKEHEIIPLLLKYAEQAKLKSSFGEKFLKHINPITKRVHPDYWQILNTGRISASKPNVAQIPSHGELGVKIRSCFEASENFKIVGGDYSGMELRIIAEFSNDPLWVKAFKEGGDLHSILCSKTFGIPIEDVKKPFPGKPSFTYRDVQKTINFG